MFMSRLISAIQNRSNALLEAPTGCGKTLALLCGALAWQAKAKKVAEEMEGAEDLELANLAFTQGVALVMECTPIGSGALGSASLL
jgi:hypothetical protein